MIGKTHWQRGHHTLCGWIADGQKLATDQSKVTCRTCRKALHLNAPADAERAKLLADIRAEFNAGATGYHLTRIDMQRLLGETP